MPEVEASLIFGTAGWPVQAHHIRRDLRWRVLEVIEPETAPAQLAAVDRYVLRCTDR